MEVILRIYFIGLIAFVPGHDGQSTTVIVESARDASRTTDGHHVDPHVPLLLARGKCSGDCRPDPERIASFLYNLPDEPASRASMRQLDAMLAEGGAWTLDDVELEIALGSDSDQADALFDFGPARNPSHRTPVSSQEAKSFDWIARMGHVAPEAAIINPRLLDAELSPGMAAARMVIDRGTLHTHRLVEVDNKIATLSFQPVAANQPASDSRAYANWVALDIEVSRAACKEGITISAMPIGPGHPRTMTIKPDCQGGVTEMAIINLPSWQAARRAQDRNPSPYGPHFELYYKLAQTYPEPSKRLVPALASNADWIEPGGIGVTDIESPLLRGLQLTDARGSFAQPICIPVAFEPPSDG